MEIKITGEPKEIAALVLAAQERQGQHCEVVISPLRSMRKTLESVFAEWPHRNLDGQMHGGNGK